MFEQLSEKGRLLGILAVALVAAACQPEVDSVVPLYDSAPVEVRDIQVTVDASGVIEPETTVEVKSKASGEILAVHADTGDIVEAGALLVEVDQRTPRNQLAEAEAGLIAARARRNIAATQMKRSETLFESGTLTQNDYEQTQLEAANAQAQVVSAEVAVENARIAMDDTAVRAPITGTIIERQVEPGTVISSPTQAVSDGTILMKMADLNAVQVRTLVDETDIGKIQPGMKTQVTVAAYPNQPFEGEVLKIEPQAIVEQNVTMFAVRIQLDNRGGLLKPGMNAEVSIQIGKREGVTAVPTAALRAMSDIPATAAMLGLPEAQLRAAIEGGSARTTPGHDAHTISIGGRTVELPADVEPSRAQALMGKAASGRELSSEERVLMRRIMGQAFGAQDSAEGAGQMLGSAKDASLSPHGASAEGSTPPTAGAARPPGFGSAPGPGMGMGRVMRNGNGNGNGRRMSAAPDYQFGGDYWVVALRGNVPEPVRVKTGLTDLEFSEVLEGLAPEDRVLLLPSTSLFEQQERLQQFISERFSSGPFQQQQGPPGRLRR